MPTRIPTRLQPRAAIRPLVAALALAASASGCAQVLAPGTAMISYDKGGPIESRDVPSDGDYALYSKYGDTTPMHVIPLARGDPIGFRAAETGKLTAVAGDHEYTLTDTSYVWNRVEH